jgi:RluA family pseudouridine synthase
VSRIRLQDYAPKIFEEFIPSNSGIKRAIKNGQIRRDGEVARTGTWVEEGQLLELILEETFTGKVYEYELDVIYEDDHVAVVDKPAGITVNGNSFKTLTNALPFNLDLSNASDKLNRPMPVHRLDNQTSGLLIIAKTRTAQKELGRQFENRTIQKRYCTIVIGKVLNKGLIQTPIDGKEAETSFEILKVVKSLKYSELSCLKVEPKTGRTHQIRKHLAAIGHPVLGDKLYGERALLHRGKGLFLCASELTFAHPATYEPIHVKIDPPQKFRALLAREKRRWNTYNH